MNTFTETIVRLISSPSTWMEGAALRQLYEVARLDQLDLVVGFPNLHPGSQRPIGAAFVARDVIYPHLIGADIGCGLTLFKTDLTIADITLDRWSEILFDLEHPWEGDVQARLEQAELDSTSHDRELGTLGGASHFAEMQTVEEVVDPVAFNRTGLRAEQLVLLVHSGSHGVGQSALRSFVPESHATGAAVGSLTAKEYLYGHDRAVRWAKANRALIAERFVTALSAQAEIVWDGNHNSIARHVDEGQAVWVHRRGAFAADSTPVVISGTCGSLSYLVKAIGDGVGHAWSLPHGAGRKWSRSESRVRMRTRFRVPELVQTALGGRVVCEQRDLLYEDASSVYKPVELVIQDLLDAGLISVIATLRPLLTYKTRALRR
jgi:release factor H-coupled RctB family protein